MQDVIVYFYRICLSLLLAVFPLISFADNTTPTSSNGLIPGSPPPVQKPQILQPLPKGSQPPPGADIHPEGTPLPPDVQLPPQPIAVPSQPVSSSKVLDSNGNPITVSSITTNDCVQKKSVKMQLFDVNGNSAVGTVTLNGLTSDNNCSVTMSIPKFSAQISAMGANNASASSLLQCVFSIDELNNIVAQSNASSNGGEVASLVKKRCQYPNDANSGGTNVNGGENTTNTGVNGSTGTTSYSHVSF